MRQGFGLTASPLDPAARAAREEGSVARWPRAERPAATDRAVTLLVRGVWVAGRNRAQEMRGRNSRAMTAIQICRGGVAELLRLMWADYRVA